MTSNEIKELAKELYETQKGLGLEMKLWHKLSNAQRKSFYAMAKYMIREIRRAKLDGLAEAFELVDVDFTSLHSRIIKYKRKWEKLQ